MADGDAASAIGLAILTSAAKVSEFFKHVNATRDMLANHITGGTHDAGAITTGQIPAARIAGVDGAGNGVVKAAGGGNISVLGSIIGVGSIGSSGGNVQVAGSVIAGTRPGIASGFTTAQFRNSDGLLGVSTSSRRFKRDIETVGPRKALLAARVVHYRYREEVDDLGQTAPVYIGFIAEELHDLGLSDYVNYDDEGLPFSVNYDRIVCDQLLILQDLDQRLTALEQKES
jgi:hypothetical protein